MLVLNVGVEGSASTWVDNVVKSLLKLNGSEEVTAGYVSEMKTAAQNHQRRVENAILKSHQPKNDFLFMMDVGAAKSILTIRDPRDSVVSLMQRFDRPFENCLRDVARSLSYLDDVDFKNVLLLRYEDRFFEKIETVGLIAEYLGTAASGEQIGEIFERYSAAAVRGLLSQLSDLPIQELDVGEHVAHRGTGFFARHIIDSRSGRYREVLTLGQIHQIESVIGHAYDRYGYERVCSVIPAECFPYGQQGQLSGDICYVTPGDRNSIVIYGPYINLPRGRWSVRFRIQGNCRVDVAENGAQIAAAGCGDRMEFEVTDPSVALEFRTYADEGPYSFAGVELTRLANGG
ncbi:sulfotransferase domain-containing protein [Pararobbsia alpina]|uniref:Sulfotransferase domain-containing protein n=1 Tax=Pararobbsia alpina TaxID=621374 RepID=A0A6S7B7W8_9BURK|nr:sulfotransferase domain-containing protein [Pararobbsia alpina]CAB3782112.1 hypothetical protein LMG28138_01443 [Pararobbsia alpina]